MSNILAVRIQSGNRMLQYRSEPYVVSLRDHVLIQVEGELHMGRVERITPVLEPVERVGQRAVPESQEPCGFDVSLGDVESTETSGQNPVESASEASPGDHGSFEENGAVYPAIFRPATEEDLIRDRENRELARNAHALCRKCITERGLDMKLVDVEVLFDGSKMIFYFTAPSRIDFRELVKDLVRSYRTRIELRQIGARHETQMLGGLGNCGQLVCCQRFLRQFAPSTIKMAKEQNLFLNPAKISGVCNRLLCCLSYEQPNYDEFLNQCPKIGKRFTTTHGTVKVIRANYFRRTLSIFMEPGGEREVDLDEWRRLVSGPKETEAAVRHKNGVKPEATEEIGVAPGKASSSPERSTSEPATLGDAGATPEFSGDQQANTRQAVRGDARPASKGSSRKKNKRSGRKGGPRPNGPIAPGSTSGQTGTAPPRATSESKPPPPDSGASSKSKRRSRSSRRKSKKQSTPTSDHG